ncbi:hypothetical protein HPB49_021423 [Dermacentor silvarum]|uniref:Uncharacterized protein n=1 Tax=Dermacentor silvarum TaxID=543639 RepID=A0ACB8C5K7_DERSI|nr:hypothetical protein HPB49_021423 [Dermacentor silvarum]
MSNGDDKNVFNERLIDAVEKERALWDLQDRMYKSRSVCEAAWRRVAAEHWSDRTSGNLKPVAEDDVHSAGGTGHNESAQQIFEEMYQDEELSVEEVGTCDNTQASNLVQHVL